MDLNKFINKLNLIIDLDNIKIEIKNIDLINIKFKNIFDLIFSEVKLNKIENILYIFN